jgi:hypothetical protein
MEREKDYEVYKPVCLVDLLIEFMETVDRLTGLDSTNTDSD